MSDMAGQIGETLKNLTSLVETAAAGRRWQFSDLRVYHPRRGDADLIAESVARWSAESRVEFAIAELCRRELLVEIEGVVRLD